MRTGIPTAINGRSCRHLGRLSDKSVAEFVEEAEARGRVPGVRIPVEDEDADEPWRMAPSRRREPAQFNEPLPDRIRVVVADQVYIDRTGLPPAMTARLVRLAAFQNPEFYRAQSMRLPTFGKPRILAQYVGRLHRQHEGKTEVLVFDYADEAVPVLARIAAKRRAGLRALGYRIE